MKTADQMTLTELIEATPAGPFFRNGSTIDTCRRRVAISLGSHDCKETAELITRLLNFAYAGGLHYARLARVQSLSIEETLRYNNAITLLDMSSIASTPKTG